MPLILNGSSTTTATLQIGESQLITPSLILGVVGESQSIAASVPVSQTAAPVDQELYPEKTVIISGVVDIAGTLNSVNQTVMSTELTLSAELLGIEEDAVTATLDIPLTITLQVSTFSGRICIAHDQCDRPRPS